MFEKFDNVEDLKILVIGDIILDKYIHGQSSRISPEAPVPIVVSHNTTHVLGGAANVAANLTSLGAEVYLAGMVGNDKDGELVIEASSNGIHNCEGIIRGRKITTTKTRIVAKGQQMLRIDNEDVAPIDENEEEFFLNTVTNLLGKHQISGIVFQDYNKGLFTSSLIKKLCDISSLKEIPFFVDPKHDHFWEYKGAALFKPNLSELNKANSSRNFTNLDEMLLHSAERLNCGLLMCTMAEEGISYVENNNVSKSTTQKIDVLDVSGAGDTALSIMVLTYLLGYSAEHISLLANTGGKVVCMKSGVSTITIQELKDAYFGIGQDIMK